jgi:phage-related holin
LDKDVSDIALPVPEYSTIQLLSSVLGLIIVIYALFQFPVTDTIKRPFFYRYWTNISAIIFSLMVIRYFTGMALRSPYEVLINFISGMILAITITSLSVRKQYYR